MRQQPPPTPTPADLRAALARYRVPLYVAAAKIRVHPVRLSRMLGGRLGLSPEIATRMLRAIQDEAGLR
jgi:plasmid maintenance system antidote protein VapI